MKQFEDPPTPFLTNLLISEQFFHDPSFQILKIGTPPLLILEGGGNYGAGYHKL